MELQRRHRLWVVLETGPDLTGPTARWTVFDAGLSCLLFGPNKVIHVSDEQELQEAGRGYQPSYNVLPQTFNTIPGVSIQHLTVQCMSRATIKFPFNMRAKKKFTCGGHLNWVQVQKSFIADVQSVLWKHLWRTDSVETAQWTVHVMCSLFYAWLNNATGNMIRWVLTHEETQVLSSQYSFTALVHRWFFQEIHDAIP